MTERTREVDLVKLSDSEFTMRDLGQDVRDRDVYDSSDEPVGSVADLYVDEEERRVRFLDVRAGGFLGIGEKDFLIPVEAVLRVDEDRVTIDQSRKKVMDAPPFDASVVPEADYQRDIYDHYGYWSGRPDMGPGAWPGGV